MRLKRLSLALAAAASLLCLVGWTGYAQRSRPRRPAWEYKTATPAYADERLLNELGAQGWELVDVSEVSGVKVFFFKRPK